MRIGFDLRPAVKKNSARRGIGRYTSQLLRALLESNPGRDFVVYLGAGESREAPPGPEVRELFRLDRPSRLAWLPDAAILPYRLRRDRLDLFHATDLTSTPQSRRTRIWAHVHDLIPFLFWRDLRPQLPWDYAFALQRAFRRLARADLIVTDSECSRKDICVHAGVRPERVVVVYPGCDERLVPMDLDSARGLVSARYGLEGSFLFYVGGSDFRKNLPWLIRAFSRIRGCGYHGRLVLGGETFRYDLPEVQAIREEVTRLGLEEWMVFPGYVSDCDLPAFYSACDLFVFPSLYEGFGLPVLEAMRCGAPVLAAEASSVPEVAGSAAAYFDPRDEQSLAACFQRVWGNAGELARMRSAGLEQARQFSWSRAARELHRLYDGCGLGAG